MGLTEDVDGVHVGHDATAGLVVVDDGAVDEALGDDAVLYQLPWMTSWCTHSGISSTSPGG